MNDRIKELAEQAEVQVRVDAISGMGFKYFEIDEDEFRSVFAELIIRECAELTLDYKSEAYYNGWLDYRDEIKEHFGVE